MWLQTILSLAGIIGLILLMFWLLRKVNKISATTSGSRLRIIDRANAGRDASILVISVSGKLMLVGVSVGRMEKLCDLDISEEEYFGSAADFENAGKKNPTFAEALGNVIGMGFGGKKGAKKSAATEEKAADENNIFTEKCPQAEGEGNTVESDNQTGKQAGNQE